VDVWVIWQTSWQHVLAGQYFQLFSVFLALISTFSSTLTLAELLRQRQRVLLKCLVKIQSTRSCERSNPFSLVSDHQQRDLLLNVSSCIKLAATTFLWWLYCDLLSLEMRSTFQVRFRSKRAKCLLPNLLEGKDNIVPTTSSFAEVVTGTTRGEEGVTSWAYTLLLCGGRECMYCLS